MYYYHYKTVEGDVYYSNSIVRNAGIALTMAISSLIQYKRVAEYIIITEKHYNDWKKEALSC